MHDCATNNYLIYLLEDGIDSMDTVFENAIPFVEDALKDPMNAVLIHRVSGISRSTTLVAAVLMKLYNCTVQDALDAIRKTRPEASPEPLYMKELEKLYQGCG